MDTQSNVIIFFCDQLRIDLMGCYGGNLVRTPNLDAFAKDATVFENCYTPIGICSPARASLMTGLYPHQHHMFNNSTPRYSYCEHLKPGLSMIPDWIAEKTEYQSAYFGKWHVGPDDDLHNSRFEQTMSTRHPNTSYGDLVKNVAGGRAGLLDVPMENFPDGMTADRSIRFLKEWRGQSDPRPFCLFTAFPGPHSPWMVPEEWGIRYDPDEIPLWPNRHDTFAGKPINQKKLRLLDYRSNDGATEAERDRQLQELLACCFSYMELVDHLFGRVVQTLKELDLYDSTTIIFTADHGDMAGSHGFTSKGGYMYDETYRIPLLVKERDGSGAAPGRGNGSGQRRRELVHLMDVTATLMHLMTGEAPDSMLEHTLHGESLLTLLHGEREWRRPVHYAEFHGDWYGHYSARMVTDGRRKLVYNLSDLCELYDLERDPHELMNRFYDPEYAAERERLFALLLDEANRLQDAQVLMNKPEIEEIVAATIGANLPLEIDASNRLDTPSSGSAG